MSSGSWLVTNVIKFLADILANQYYVLPPFVIVQFGHIKLEECEKSLNSEENCQVGSSEMMLLRRDAEYEEALF